MFTICITLESRYTRESLCKLYSGNKGEVDARRSTSLSDCQMYCKLQDDCVKTIFLWRFECCVYHDNEEDYNTACSSIKVKTLFDSSGCESKGLLYVT